MRKTTFVQGCVSACVAFFLLSPLTVSANNISESASDTQHQPTSFAFMTDTHVSIASRSCRDLSRSIADINSLAAQEAGPSFVIISGDLTDFGTDEQLAAVKLQLDSLVIPYYVVPGNHDAKWSESGCNSFVRTFGYESFSIDTPCFRIIGCPSGPDMRMAPALIPKHNIKWLRDMASDQSLEQKPTIFVNHYPIDTTILNYCDVRAALRALDTRFVLGGHMHVNKAMEYDGIPAAINRSNLSSSKQRSGYSLVTIQDNTISIAERNPEVPADGANPMLPAKTTPWLSHSLSELPASAADPDAHGLPHDFPWMRYDVNESYPQLSEVWRIDEDFNIASGFAYNGCRRAFYATETGILKCIDIRNGKQKWEVQLPGKVFSTPVYAKGKVLVGCADGGMYAFSARSGKQVWVVPTQKSVLATAAVHRGRVYFGASDGIFRAVRLRNGKTLWEREGIEGFVESVALVDDEQVVFGSWGRRLYSLDPDSGELQWCWQTPKHSVMYSPAACVPCKSSGRIFITAPDRITHVLDARSGEELAAVDGGREALTISRDGSTVFVKTMHNKLYAFPAAGEVTEGTIAKSWECESGLGYDIGTTALLELDGVLYVPTDKGNIVAYSSTDGSLLWKHKIALGLVNPLCVVKLSKGAQTVLASTMDGAVCALKYNRK